MPDWSQDIKEAEQDFSSVESSQSQGSSSNQQQQSDRSNNEQQSSNSGQGSGGNDNTENMMVDTAVDEFAQKEGMSAAFDPLVNKEVNEFVDKEL